MNFELISKVGGLTLVYRQYLNRENIYIVSI